MQRTTHSPGQQRELPLPRLDSSAPLPDELFVVGGWGYSQQDACVVLDFLDDDDEQDGEIGGVVECEYAFIRARLAVELSRMPARETFHDIRWNVLQQELRIDKDSGNLDHIIVSVTALKEEDIALLRETFPNQDSDDEGYMEARRALVHEAVRDYWFSF